MRLGRYRYWNVHREGGWLSVGGHILAVLRDEPNRHQPWVHLFYVGHWQFSVHRFKAGVIQTPPGASLPASDDDQDSQHG